MPTFCLLLTLSTLSLGFAILFKQHHYQRANSDEHVWFYYSVYSYVSYNEVIDEKYCEFLDGGKRALPLTTEETTALFDGVVPVVQIRMEDGYQQQDRRFYIGAYKENMTSDWVMRDGSAVTHFDWGSNQPNNAGLCTLIRLSTSYQPEYWSDTSCDVLRGFICQITITNYHSTSQSSGSELKCGSNFCPSTGTEKKARSKVRCSWLCHQDSSCSSVKFNQKTGECLLAVDGSDFDTSITQDAQTVCCFKT